MKCEICKKEFKSLFRHIKTHKISKKEYLDNFFEHNKCKFCEKPAKWGHFGTTIGYNEFCEICASYKCTHWKFWVIRYNLSEKEARKKVSNLQSRDEKYFLKRYGKDGVKIHKKYRRKIAESYKETIIEKKSKNPNWTKEKSHNCIEYWLKRGYSQEESQINVTRVMKNIHDKTLGNLVGFSKISQELFWILYSKLDSDNSIKFAELNSELKMENCFYDFVYKDIIIEFHGDHWHGRDENTFFNPQGKTRKEIIAKDNYKKLLAKRNGFKVFVIWESDYKRDKEGIINDITRKIYRTISSK